jgi:hypothetical protein
MTDLGLGGEPDDAGDDLGDRHAAGTPGGGTEVGGLAGGNAGAGGPDEHLLEEAFGAGGSNAGGEADEEPAYAGRHGGAVGGTPANRRARGGRTGRGLRPRADGPSGPSAPSTGVPEGE